MDFTSRTPIAELKLINLQALWAELNRRYFRSALPAISIQWGSRLTASLGLFYSRCGPRAGLTDGRVDAERRLIRLSLPLFRQLYGRHADGSGELSSTLAHEMIHQWQYDILKRRPNHGADFRRMMQRMNQDGLRVTVYHSMLRDTDSFTRYSWRCQHCGYLYHRQRRTIRPHRHQCGACRGPLREMTASDLARPSRNVLPVPGPSRAPLRSYGGPSVGEPRQLSLDFAMVSPTASVRSASGGPA
jgi:predicted SprT family Zn-dependent metalloprotease